MTAPTRATIVAPWAGATAGALVRWTATETTIRDAGGRDTVLRHGSDVDALALRRVSTDDRGNVWTLDLMKGDACRYRLQVPPWEFDREFGPPQASEVSGLPLDRRPSRLTTEPPLADPLPRRAWAGPLVGLVLLGVAVTLAILVVPSLRDVAWLVTVAGALPLPFLVAARRPRPRGGQVVYRARPSGRVPRGFLRKGVIVRGDDLLTIHTGGWSTSLPLPDDACGPRLLQRVGTPGGGPNGSDTVELRAADGRTLIRFVRREWCPGDTDRDLAAALGVEHDATVAAPGTTGFDTRAEGSIKGSNSLLVVAALPGALGLPAALSLSDDAVLKPLAIALTGACLVLGLLGEAVSMVRHQRDRTMVDAPPTGDAA